MKSVLKHGLLVATVVTLVSACATKSYTSASPMMRVGPSKMWYRSGVSGKDAYDTWQQCIALPGNRKVTDACMKEKGFKYMKYPPCEQIYVPLEPVPKAWVKPGVSYVEAARAGNRCFDLADKDPAYLEARERAGQGLALAPGQKNHYLLHKEAGEACMRDQGFVFRELEESEWPPCWYVGEHKENCRPRATSSTVMRHALLACETCGRLHGEHRRTFSGVVQWHLAGSMGSQRCIDKRRSFPEFAQFLHAVLCR